MIVLDTNVLSELLRAEPAAPVLAWVGRQPRASLFTTSVTWGEVLYGIQLLTEGKRRRALLSAAKAMFEEDFAGRVLAFDGESAEFFAEIAASRRAAGKPISQLDAMIAAMTRARGAVLATRNAKDFDSCGLKLVDPWKS